MNPWSTMIYKGCDSMLWGQIHWKVWKSWQGMQVLIILLWMRQNHLTFLTKAIILNLFTQTKHHHPTHPSPKQISKLIHTTHHQIHLIQTSLHFLPCLHLNNHWCPHKYQQKWLWQDQCHMMTCWHLVTSMSSLQDPMIKSSWLFWTTSTQQM